MARKKNARPSDQTRRAEMRSSIKPQYIMPLIIAAAATMAYPVVDTITNMRGLEYLAVAFIAIGAAIAAGVVTERARCR